VYWNAGGNNTGALGTGWSLTMSDFDASTYFSGYWKFETSGDVSVQSITLNGFDHNVVFDNDIENKETPGSEWGNPLMVFNSISQYGGSIDVTYTGLVGLNDGNDPFGDIYRSMTIGFVGGLFTSENSLAYFQDTDNLHNPVPEPSTMLLFGFGLVGLAGISRARKR